MPRARALVGVSSFVAVCRGGRVGRDGRAASSVTHSEPRRAGAPRRRPGRGATSARIAAGGRWRWPACPASRSSTTSAAPAAASGRPTDAGIDLEAGHRRPARHGLGRRDRGRGVRSRTSSTSGMGESCIRGNVSHGDGVYKSTDAGKTWKHVGLARHAADRARARAPEEPRPRLRRRARPRVRAEPGARRLPLEGRRRDLAERALRATTRRARWTSSLDPDEPARALRRLLAGAAHALGLRERRARAARSTRPPTAATPGQKLDAARACRRRASWGRIGVAVSPANPNRVWAIDRGRGRRRLPLRRRGQDLAADQRGAATCASAPGTTRTSTPTRRTPTPCTC